MASILGKLGEQLLKAKTRTTAAGKAFQRLPDRPLTPDEIAKINIDIKEDRFAPDEISYMLRRTNPDAGVVKLDMWPASRVPQDIRQYRAESMDFDLPMTFRRDAEQNAREMQSIQDVLDKMGPSRVSVADTSAAPEGYGAQIYKIMYDLNKQQNAANFVENLSPINQRRRTSNMLQQLLHDPQAGKRSLVYSPQQNLTDEDALSPLEFYMLSPEEQIGYLAKKETQNLRQSLPYAERWLASLDPLNSKIGDRITGYVGDQRARLKESGALNDVAKSLLGPNIMRRAKLTTDILDNPLFGEQVDPNVLIGVGGYKRGGRVR